MRTAFKIPSLLLMLIVASQFALAQSGTNTKYVPFSDKLPDYVAAKKAYDNRNYNFAKSTAERLIKFYPEEALLYKLAALSNMQFSQYDLAFQQIKMAYTLDPIDFEILTHMSIFSALTGKPNEAVQYAGYLAKMVNQDWFNYLTSYMSNWQNAWSQANPTGAATIGRALGVLRSEFPKYDHSFYEAVFRNIFIDCQGTYIARSKSSLESRFNGAIRKIYDLGLPRDMMHRVMYFVYNGAINQSANPQLSRDKRNILYDFGYNWIEARMWGEQEQGRVTNPFLFCRFTDSKYRYFLEAADLERAVALNTSRIEMAQRGTLMRFELFNLFGDKLYLLGYLNRRNEGASYAEALQKIDGQYTSPLHISKAYGALSNYYRTSNPSLGVAYGKKQVDYMLSTGYTVSLSLAYNDLGSAYIMNKDVPNALDAYLKSAELSPTEGGRGTNYYNVAVRLWNGGAKKEAIEVHLKAEKSLTSHLKNLDEFSRNRFYINLYNNNALLALDYHKMGDNKASFEALERAKSLDLALNINEDQQPQTLEQVQSMLSADQLLIYYASIKFRSEDGNFIMYAISKEGIDVKLLNPIDAAQAYDGLRIIRTRYKKALENVEKEVASRELRQPSFQLESDRLNKGDFSLITERFRLALKSDLDYVNDEFSKAYYAAFLKPFATAMAGKSELIIVPDDALYYLPFEAIKDDQGKYLVESFDVSYIQSPTVLKAVQERSYGNQTKSILAMGGANFNPPNQRANLIKSYNDVQRIKLKVFEDIGNGKKSMRQSWIDLGHSTMNYLPGTVSEVNKIKETVPTAEVYLGDDMSETNLKNMSASGDLNQFKVLHFATHGWVESLVPDLSGFTLTLFPDQRNGEDGIIYLHEVEQLKLNADLVMLSACQTALGKEEMGKGVSGLNKSFLAAGANSTITSLWAVNDYATSILASEIYRMVFDEGKTYHKAINQVKRNFIQGVYDQNGVSMRKISFWAPFIYYGKI